MRFYKFCCFFVLLFWSDLILAQENSEQIEFNKWKVYYELDAFREIDSVKRYDLYLDGEYFTYTNQIDSLLVRVSDYKDFYAINLFEHGYKLVNLFNQNDNFTLRKVLQIKLPNNEKENIECKIEDYGAIVIVDPKEYKKLKEIFSKFSTLTFAIDSWDFNRSKARIIYNFCLK
ncbi:hypothetical protein [Aureivirga sp. CE67]|uniref:hypothetical protein n=1 Tax=Aureivirga sp. CE67 TaxID=1788983 RepID=UPI0018C9AD6B|nr:hypothetical protein [Aureivirga sp. CE67]